MKLSDLVEGYELMCSTSQHDPLYSESGRTILLHDDESVRIYLDKEPENWHEIFLEIEVSILVGRHPNADSVGTIEGSIDDDDEQQQVSRTQLLDCILYMEYLVRLETAGFSLGFVLDECIWTARYLVESRPDSQLYQTIIPPNRFDLGGNR